MEEFQKLYRISSPHVTTVYMHESDLTTAYINLKESPSNLTISAEQKYHEDEGKL